MRGKLLKFFLALTLIFFAGLCARYALAGYFYQSAKDRYSLLTTTETLNVKELKSIIAVLDNALSYRAEHANALDLSADLLYQLWWISPDGQYLHQSNYLQKALELHLKSQKIRHHWSYSAARIALIYSHQHLPNKNFSHWFYESHRLGLYETDIALSLAELGLQNWSYLTGKEITLTTDFIRVSIEQKKNSPKSMAQLLRKYKKHAQLCAVLLSTNRKNEMCAMPL